MKTSIDSMNNAGNTEPMRPFTSAYGDELGKTIAGQVTDISKAIKKNPEDIKGYLCRGMLYSIKAEFTKLLLAFNKTLGMDREDSTVRDDQHTIHSLKCCCDMAIQDYDKALELDPEAAAVYESRGGMHLHKCDHEKAIADYERAIELDPANTLAREGHAMALFQKELFEEVWSYVNVFRKQDSEIDREFLIDLFRASA